MKFFNVLLYFTFLIFAVVSILMISRIINLPVTVTDIFDLNHSNVRTDFDLVWKNLLIYQIIQISAALFIALGLIIKSRKNDITEIHYENLSNELNTTDEYQHSEAREEAFNTTAFISHLKQEVLRGKTAKEVGNRLINTICNTLEASQGIFYLREPSGDDGEDFLKVVAGYAYYKREDGELKFRFGEGLAGQAAKSKQMIVINHIPEGYITIVSGLGESSPNKLLLIPIVHRQQTIAVMEIASFRDFPSEKLSAIEEGISWATRVLHDKYAAS